MGVGQMYPLLAAMLTARPWDDIVDPRFDSLTNKRKTAADDSKIAGYVQQYAHHIADILNKVPPEMLLLFKTNDCLRHSDRMLGTPVNTFLITAQTCCTAIDRERQRMHPGLLSWARGLWEWLHLSVRLNLFQIAVAWKLT